MRNNLCLIIVILAFIILAYSLLNGKRSPGDPFKSPREVILETAA